MNVYDTAHKLAEEIKQSTEYLNYKKAKEEVDKDPMLKEKRAKFEELKYQIQIAALQAGTNDKAKMEEGQKLYAELLQYPGLKEYFDAEMKFSILLADVNRIIGESVKDVLGNGIIG